MGHLFHQNLVGILKCFHITFGLKVKFQKSRLFGIGISDTDLHRQAQVLGCLRSTFSLTYLGVPRPIIEKFHSRLSIWKEKTLSFGGRLTLIESVFNRLPTYYLSSPRVFLSLETMLGFHPQSHQKTNHNDCKKLKWCLV
uniref:Uncharacterized protein n=1 Tax=Lactuca sativa TaxID=4236 RepID=A0A9R1V972_LACSA|nr:hypothetical protein LSAT_V11C500263050 [Lactuca sativa]